MAETPKANVAVPTRVRPKPRIFYGWWIVLAAAGINVYGAGVWFFGFPIFLGPAGRLWLDRCCGGRRHLPFPTGRGN